MLDIYYLSSSDSGFFHFEQSSNAVCQQEQRHMNVVFQYELPGFGRKYCRLGGFPLLVENCVLLLCCLKKGRGYRPKIKLP